MTIDEAIAHAREVAKKQRKDNDNCKYKSEYGCKGCVDYYSKPCNECAEEHEQLAEWLEELKCYKNDNDFSDYADRLHKIAFDRGYDKAIDDFAEKLNTDVESFTSEVNGMIADLLTLDYFSEFVFEIAEQLKRGGNNVSTKSES